MAFFLFRGPFLESPGNLISDPQRHFFCWSVFKNGEVYTPETSCMKRTSAYILICTKNSSVIIRFWDFVTVFRGWKLFGTFEKRVPGRCTPLVPVADSEKWSRDDKHLLVTGPYSLQHSCCKFLGGSKFGANLMHLLNITWSLNSSSRDNFFEAWSTVSVRVVFECVQEQHFVLKCAIFKSCFGVHISFLIKLAIFAVHTLLSFNNLDNKHIVTVLNTSSFKQLLEDVRTFHIIYISFN